ncbi:MAG: hypothetical protein HY877_03395 [Deltaproteobacteria bacterium]|nr:hypothetical protein [Deltaproteobacteria bacterium]
MDTSIKLFVRLFFLGSFLGILLFSTPVKAAVVVADDYCAINGSVCTPSTPPGICEQTTGMCISHFCVRDIRPYCCGNGTVDYNSGETCDDRNNTSGDGCDWECRTEVVIPPAIGACTPTIQAIDPASGKATFQCEVYNNLNNGTVPNGVWTYIYPKCDDTLYSDDTHKIYRSTSTTPNIITCSFSTVGNHTIGLQATLVKNGLPITNAFSQTKTVTVTSLCTPNELKTCTLSGANVNSACSSGYQTCNTSGDAWGACVASTTIGWDYRRAITCSTSNVCMEHGVCKEDGSCQETPVPNGTACDDAVRLTTNDVCTDGVCRGTSVACLSGDSQPCSNANGCTGTQTCGINNAWGACSAASTKNICGVCGQSDPANYGQPCYFGTGDCRGVGTVGCNSVCSATTFKANGSVCNDEDVCTIGDACRSGVCTGAPRNCDDFNPCTRDGCSVKFLAGCYHTNLANGPAPTGDGFCLDGNLVNCAPGATQNCVLQGNTNDCKKGQQICSASGAWGSCTAVNVADNTRCDDGNFCTTVDTCQSGVCTGFKPILCPEASDTCHVAGTCNAQGQCSPETEIGGKPIPSACQSIICRAGQWALVDKLTKLKGDECHTLQCGATGWALVEKPECIIKAIVLPEGSAASSKIFDVAKRADDPDSDNRTCTVLLNSFDSVNGSALFYSGDFEKQFLIVTGANDVGKGLLALVPPKAMGELGTNCTDLGSKIQYRNLSRGPLEKIAVTQISGKNALVGVSEREYCYYADINQILQPATILPAPICFPTDEAGNPTRIWQGEYCDVSKIDTFKGFAFGNTSYLVGGVECGSESANVAGLDICNKTAEEDHFQCSFVTLQKLSAQEKVTYFRLVASDKEGKFYAILVIKDGNNLFKKLIEVSKDASGWNPVARDISEIPGVIISKDKIKRDLPASEVSGNKIFITESGEVQEMKEDHAQSRVERHDRVHGFFVDIRETTDARFAPDDNAWNVYGDKDCGIMGEQITLDANNNPAVAVLEEENLTADSSQNNILNDPMLRLCHPKYLVPLTRKNYGGTDLAAIFEVFDTSIADNPRAAGFALSFFFNINEKPKLEPKDSVWDGTNGYVKFEASDVAHDALKNSVKSFKDASGNDISCWVDKIEEKQVLFTKKGSCQSGAANITLNALPPAVSTAHSLSAAKAADSGVGKEPLTMVVCASDPGNASGCNSFQLSKAVAVVGGVAEIPGEVAVAVTGETDAGTPMGYKISGGCSLVKGSESNNIIGYILLMVFALSLIVLRTPLVDKIKKNMV